MKPLRTDFLPPMTLFGGRRFHETAFLQWRIVTGYRNCRQSRLYRDTGIPGYRAFLAGPAFLPVVDAMTALRNNGITKWAAGRTGIIAVANRDGIPGCRYSGPTGMPEFRLLCLPLGDDIFQGLSGVFHLVVDDLVLVFVGAGHFGGGIFQACFDGGFGFGAAAAEASFQFFQ